MVPNCDRKGIFINGKHKREVKRRVQARWSRLICNRRKAAKLKGQAYNVVVRPATICGLEKVETKLKGARLR